ncbi:hypothetical protein ACFX1S_024125 [Malus domestica]
MMFPRMPRWKVTHKETLGPISELTGAAVIIRDQYFPPGKVPGPGDCKVFLFIEVLLKDLSREVLFGNCWSRSAALQNGFAFVVLFAITGYRVLQR